MSKRDDDYAAALATLDHMHEAGDIAGPAYEVKRARLLAEASSTEPTRGRYLLRLTVIVVLVFVLLGLLAWILSAVG